MIKSQSLEKLVKWGVLAVFLAIPLVYFPNKVFGFGSAKIFLFFGIVEILLVLWAWLLVYDARYRMSRKMLLWFLAPAGFLVFLTVSGVVGVDASTSFFGTVNRGTGLIFLYHCFAFALIFTSIARVRGMQFFENFLRVNIFSGVVLSIVTFFTNFSEVKGYLSLSTGGAMLGNTSFAAAYLLFAIFFTVFLFAGSKSPLGRALYGLAAVVILTSPIFFNADIWRGMVGFSDIIQSPLILIGEAKMAAVSVAFGTLMVSALWMALAGRDRLIRALGVFGVIVIFSGIVFICYQLFQPGSQVHTIFVETTGDARFFFWDFAMEGIKERPVFGWGAENYRVVYHKYFNPEILPSEAARGMLSNDRPHNGFLEVLVNGGILGFAGYLTFLGAFVALVVTAFKRSILSPFSSAVLIGMFFAYILQNQLLFDTIMSYIVFFALFGALVGLLFYGSSTEQLKSLNIKTKKIIAGTLTVVMLPSFIFFSVIPSRQVTAITKIIYSSANHSQDISGYEPIINSHASGIILNDFGFFMGELYGVLRGDFQRASTPEERNIVSNKVLAALNASDKVLERSLGGAALPSFAHQFINLYMTATKDITEERISQAKRYAELAIKHRPQNPFVYVNYSQTLAYAGEIEEARVMADYAIELKPDFRPSREYKVLFEKFFGTNETYNRAVEDARKYFPDFSPKN